jgi:tetratricopeptide (TPR) repeat protein
MRAISLAIAVLCAVTVTGAAPQAPQTARHPSLDEMYLAYSKGDTDVVARSLQTRDDFTALRASLFAAIGLRKNDWRPTHAALLFDVAMAGFNRGWPDALTLLLSTRDMIVGRKDPPGARPEIDRFEITFHHAAIAFLQGRPMQEAAQSYLQSLEKRIAPQEDPDRPVLVDPQIALTRALTLEMGTMPFLTQEADRAGYAWVVPPRDGDTRRKVEAALAAMTGAAGIESTAAEANVRRAFLLHRLGQNEDALPLLDQTSSTDPIVIYWSQLIRGRVLGALDRTDEAAAAYEQAAASQPQAQTPAVALSTLFLLHDRREDALHWADVARTRTGQPVDPWLRYLFGDARRLPGWVQALREARP